MVVGAEQHHVLQLVSPPREQLGVMAMAEPGTVNILRTEEAKLATPALQLVQPFNAVARVKDNIRCQESMECHSIDLRVEMLLTRT